MVDRAKFHRSVAVAKKAFDSIDDSFMETVLKTLGFCKYIREWIKLFFSGRGAYILMGGHLTEKIILELGVPQGDVVSVYPNGERFANKN